MQEFLEGKAVAQFSGMVEQEYMFSQLEESVLVPVKVNASLQVQEYVRDHERAGIRVVLL